MTRATDLFGPELPDLTDIDAQEGQPAASIFELFSNGDYERPEYPLPLAGKMTNKAQYAYHLQKFLPVGRVNAIDAVALARCLGLPWERTEAPLRGLLRTFTLRYGWPIGSITQGDVTGFYLIDSDREAQAYTDQLQSRMEALAERIDAVKKGWARRKTAKADGLDWPRRG